MQHSMCLPAKVFGAESKHKAAEAFTGYVP